VGNATRYDYIAMTTSLHLEKSSQQRRCNPQLTTTHATMGIQPRKGRPSVKVDEGAMRLLFGVPQPLAAKELGISLTALKQICRKLGVERWPYQRGGQLPAPMVRQLRAPSIQEAVDVSPHGDSEGEGEALARSSSASSCVSFASQSPSSSTGLQEDDACLTMTSFNFPPEHFSSQSVSSFCFSTDCDDDFESDLGFFADIDKAMQSGGGWVEHYAREATIELDH